jgi:methyl-accepting chemotaxis protein
LKNLSTKAKLILSFAAIFLVNVFFGLYAIRSVSVVNGRVIEANSWTEGIAQLGELLDNVSSVRRSDLSYILQTDEANKSSTMRRRDEAIKGADDIMNVYKYEVETIPYDTEEQRKEDLYAINVIMDAWKSYLNLSQTIIRDSDEGRPDHAVTLLNGESLRLYDELDAAMNFLIDFNEEGCAEVTRMSEAIYRATRRNIIAILVATSIFSVGIPIFLVGGIKRSIDELLRVSKALGEGNLRVASDIESGDEFGLLSREYNLTISSIKSLIKSMQGTAENLAGAANEFRESADRSSSGTELIARSVGGVSRQSERQLSEIESVTAMINGVAGAISDMTRKIDSIAQGAAESVTIAREGGESMKRAVAQMNVIESAVNTSSRVVTALGERSGEIGRIVEAISGISSQTNLLALNAAIEAARAGEQGRGFAVVADEVKKLAGESQTATEEITRLITSIQEETSKAVAAMNTGRDEAKRGSSAVSDGGRAFSDLAERSVNSSEGLASIAAAMHGMASETSGIVSAVRGVAAAGSEIARDAESIVSATEEQSASMNEVSESSRDLARIAREMLDSAKRFSV